MKACLLVPGSGGTFYCQNCLRDYALVPALRRQRHDAIMMPLYLPPFGSENQPAYQAPVFFGGINVYLQQRFALFRKTPRWMDWLFDTPWMLKRAAAQEGSTNAAQLGPMTLSMLEGRQGCQHKEFDRLIDWLKKNEKPDVIHVSNALLLGLALELKPALGAAIVCSLQDEEPWIEAMPSPWKERCWKAIAHNARHVDRFIATSAWYARRMSPRLNLPPEHIAIVYPGVDPGEAPPATLEGNPPTIGFLSRINAAQGFDHLVDAFIQLKQETALKNLRLHATGGCTAMDRAFVGAIRQKLRHYAFENDVEFVPEFHQPHRRQFLQSLSVLSTPAPQGEAFGIQLIDAMAAGVPVVQPNIGAYPEVVLATGGGLLYDPENPQGLTGALRSLLLDPEKARALGRAGRDAVQSRFNNDRVAMEIAGIYETVVAQTRK